MVFLKDFLDVGFSQDLVLIRNFRIWILLFLDIGYFVLADTKMQRRAGERELFRPTYASARRTSVLALFR